ncbi:MAG TPA: glycoside hydrolase domain-containing protein [Kofleriaceae bacterium]|nr:glycoside hydrolase domain-containing protein [Kofleriaceae bacterium]
MHFRASLLLLAACAAEHTSADTAAQISIQRGTDRASVFSAQEASVLAAQGVQWTGVYIGGPCSGGSGWSRAAVEALASSVHWQFMPIFVGQQAPSICGASEMSYARGQDDGAATAQQMAAFGWAPRGNIPVALDLEAGTYFNDPAGSTSYVHGWIDAVHASGYLAYVYSGPAAIVHYADAGLAMDAVWVASYFYNGFANVTPYDLSQIGTRFSASNRAWQYAGDFAVAGAGRVDADVSDLLLAPAPGRSNGTITGPRRDEYLGIASTLSGGGYWIVKGDGGVFSYGDAAFHGSAGGSPINEPTVSIATTADGSGYWLTASDGGVFSYGDAPFMGSTGGVALNAPMVGVARGPGGYWLAAADGGVFSFGAPFHGSAGSIRLAAPVVGIAARPQGDGYWLAAADGGVFSFGAPFFGSAATVALAQPVVGIAATPSGAGYWLVAADGGVFAFGDARFFGSAAGLPLAAPVVGIAARPQGDGYWLVAADGGVFAFGGAGFDGRPQ